MSTTHAAISALAALTLAVALAACAGAPPAPAESPADPATPRTPGASASLEDRLRAHLETLCEAGPGARNFTANPDAYRAAAAYITEQFESLGYATNTIPVADPKYPPNIEAVLEGTDPALPCLVVGAHYDTEPDTPGADDNATGVAAVIEIARLLQGDPRPRTVRFVAFPNEESPYFATPNMGSLAYANHLIEQNTPVHAMISVEMIGYFSDEPGSQDLPDIVADQYPSEGNFLAVVSRPPDADIVDHAHAAMDGATPLPIYKAVLPPLVRGVAASDHYAFWITGSKAIMITDTSYYRNPHYHTPSDTPDTLDYPRFAQATEATLAAVRALADPATSPRPEP